ncbi:MAG: tRNA dihydrouridine synthase DusB [Patescibacteria group bacterium]|nr:tRNA dihydrouridine synthase DusB [Patescibacteria group bacterium]
MALSPMADFTDLPFCRLVRECSGKEVIIFREMASAEAIIRGNQRTDKICELDPVEHPVVQQLFGSDPMAMAEAAKIVMQAHSPDGIDINMGCPVPKAVNQFNGASLMKDVERASEIVKAVKDAINVPLSVKTRLGWSEPGDVVEFVKRLEEAGADAIEIHGRTKTQGYSGIADWEAAGKAISKLSIPAFVNGDIIDDITAKEALSKSGAQGFLIARGALGRPWIFKRIKESLETGKDPGDPSIEEKMEIMLKHAEYQVEVYGEKGLIKLRKHLPWYFKNITGFRQFRADAVTVSSIKDIKELFRKVLSRSA